MISLFLGLTTVNLLCLCLAAALGYATPADRSIGHWHILAGALAAMTCVAVHCVVFTYFIATAKWARHAVNVKRLDPELVAPTRSFKAQAFPAALLAMFSVFLAAIFGAVVDNYGIDPIWHHLLALLAIAINIVVAGVEYRAVSRNGKLIDHILGIINGASSPNTSNAA